MFGKLSKNITLKHIGVVSLSNVGDVVLTAPVIDVFLRDFPNSDITVIVGPKAASLFANHPRLKVIVFDKQQRPLDILAWCWGLRKFHFDCFVDLRQSGLGFFVTARYKTPLWSQTFEGHARAKHLARLATIYPDFVLQPNEALAIIPIGIAELKDRRNYVVIAPGAADERKRWAGQGFKDLAVRLIDHGEFLVFTGDASDVGLVDQITTGLNPKQYLSLAGRTDLCGLAAVLQSAQYAVVNDSGTMHLASYVDLPCVAIWGPTDLNKYGPWSSRCVVVKNPAGIQAVGVEDVLNAIASVK